MLGKLGSCEDARATFSERFEGFSKASELLMAQTHADSCPSCRQMADNFEKVDLLLREAPLIMPPPDFASQVMGKVGAMSQPQRSFVPSLLLHFERPQIQILGAGALLLTLLVLSVTLWQSTLLSVMPSFTILSSTIVAIASNLLRAAWAIFSLANSQLVQSMLLGFSLLATMLLASWVGLVKRWSPSYN